MIRKVVVALVILFVAVPAEARFKQHMARGKRLYHRALKLSKTEAKPLLEDALKAFDQALLKRVDPSALYFKALCLMELRRYDEARDLLEAVKGDFTTPRDLRRKIPGLLRRIDELEAQKPAAPTTFTINIETVPRGAQVFLNHEPIGPSPIKIQKPPGTYKVVVKQDGYEDAKGTVQVISNPVTRTFELSKIGGTITIKTVGQDGVTVAVNGNIVGNAPITLKRPPGEYRIVAYKRGYEKWSESFDLEVGDSITRGIRLDPIGKPTSGYRIGAYVTLGVGVASIAIAGILHGVALSNGDQADQANQDWVSAWDIYNDAEIQMQAAYAMYAVGSVALAGSVALFVVDAMRPKKRRRSTTLMLSPMPNGASINATISF